MTDENLDWISVGRVDDLPEGRVKTVTARTTSICLVHFDGKWAAMNNHCPHQRGPLGEGSIEKGIDDKCWIRCPWHGWDFDPLTGKPPGGHEDSGQEMYPLDIRDGEIFVGIEAEPTHARTVTDTIVETLTNWGLQSVFGMVGHSNLGLSDAIRLAVGEGKLKYYGIRHEGAAAFAASAYGKLTGKPAGCLTIAGPGATNLLTGMWDAKVDRAPILALTGQVQTQVMGPGAFQDIDLKSAFQAVSAFSQPVLRDSNHAELASLACKTALIDQNVAHLIFPDDVQTLPSDQTAGKPDGRISAARIRPAQDDLDAAADIIASAKRPVIIVGHGAYGVRDKVAELSVRLGAPVLTTFKAKGLVPDDHPNAGGVLGRSGTPIASWFMNEADLIIALGASFSNHTGIESSKRIIQVDYDRMQLGKFHAVELPIWGDVGAFCEALDAKQAADASDQISELAQRWAIWREEKRARLAEDHGKGIHSYAIFEALGKLVPDNTIFAVDVGNNTYSFGRYLETKGAQRVLMSGYLGSIGFGFPAGMGAWAATQDIESLRGHKVVSISGDGGFGQYPMDFTTAVKYGMDVTHILLHNGELGKISKEQRSGEWPVWETDLHNPSFAAFRASLWRARRQSHGSSQYRIRYRRSSCHKWTGIGGNYDRRRSGMILCLINAALRFDNSNPNGPQR